jgi:cold shock CspA family protein
MADRFRSFDDMGSQAYGRTSTEEKKKMNSNRVDSPLLTANCKYYSHERNFGFIYVEFPEKTKTPFNLTAADKDPQPGTKWQAGETLERPVVVEAFIHGSVLVKAGYKMGLEENETLQVRLKEDNKGRGLQAFWTTPQEGAATDDADSRKVRNERRVANAFLPFVSGKVKKFDDEKGFGFVTTKFDCETGEPLANDSEVEVYFKSDMVERANISDLKEGDEVQFKYWKYSDDRCKVAQFRFPERDSE